MNFRPILIAPLATLLLLFLLASHAPAAPPAYPLKVNPGGRFLVDQHDQPVLVVGDTASPLPNRDPRIVKTPGLNGGKTNEWLLILEAPEAN